MVFVIEGLKDRSRIRGHRRKRVLLPFFDSFSCFNAKGLFIKVILEIALVSLTPRVHTVFLNFTKIEANFAILASAQKQGYLESQFYPYFI